METHSQPSSIGTLNINCNIADNKVTIIKASDKIVLSDGFRSGTGTCTYFHAYIQPFFICSQYPGGKSSISNNSYYFDDYEVLYVDNKKTEEDLTIEKSHLIGNYPNPFDESTTIKYKICKVNNVIITISDQYGRELIRLENNIEHEPGIYQIIFNKFNLKPGIYSYTLLTDDNCDTKKMIIK